MTRGNHGARRRVGAALAAGVLLSLPAPPPAAAGPAGDAVRRLRAGADGPVLATWHEGAARVRTLRGRLSPPSAGAPEEVAGRFLRERADLFGLEGGTGDLSLASVRRSPGGTHLAYRETLGGLPVFNGGLDVHLDREGRIRIVHNRHAPVGPPAAPAALSAAAGVAAAAGDLGRVLQARGGAAAPGARAAPREPAVDGEPELGVFLDGAAPRLAWRFVLRTRRPVSVVEYTVDARDGALLQRRDLVQPVVATGWGYVFDPNPVNKLNDSSLADAMDDSAFTGSYVAEELWGITYKPRRNKYLLRGEHVSVTDRIEPPYYFRRTRGIVFRRRQPYFLYYRGGRRFEHVMCYYHIDENQRHIQALGFADSVNHRPIRVDPHGLGGADGSHYVASPVGAGYLAFGTGGVDDAEDADVILHEYAHAIQDNQAPGRFLGPGVEARAMGEGFADYWAASSTHDKSVLHGFDPACVGEWDAAPGCLARVDGTKKYPDDMVGDPDRDGELWSAALWALFQATGDRTGTEAIVLQSHFLVPQNPTFSDGVEALLAADELLNRGLYQSEICSVMSYRGIRTEGCGFHARLQWSSALIDLDLRLRPPDGLDYEFWDYGNDCQGTNPRPDWGIPDDPSDDPLIRYDCRYDCTEEQIVLTKFTTPGTYEVLVHYYDHLGWQVLAADATLEVSWGATPLFSGSATLANVPNYPDDGDLWRAYTFEIP